MMDRSSKGSQSWPTGLGNGQRSVGWGNFEVKMVETAWVNGQRRSENRGRSMTAKEGGDGHRGMAKLSQGILHGRKGRSQDIMVEHLPTSKVQEGITVQNIIALFIFPPKIKYTLSQESISNIDN